MEARRHLAVSDLTCPHCTDKDRELEVKARIVKTLQLELNRAMDDLAGMTEAARAAGKATVAAKGRRTKQAKEAARLEQIEQVVAHWRSHRPRTTEAFGEPGSKSFDVIEKALVLMVKDEAGPVPACCEAIDGLHIAPWESYGRRYSKPGPNRTLRRDVEHALRDEVTIERCRRIVRWVRSSEARAFDMWRAACETEEALLRAWTEEHDRRLRDDGSFEVDGIVVREDGR